MPTVVRDGVDLHYETTGHGPALLLPYCNASWDGLDLRPLAERFTVIIASPRGFAASARLDGDAVYRVADLARDVIAVVEKAGFVRFSVLGYSLTGAFAPWLAHLTGRVDAVVSGGFPIVGDYSSLYAEVRRQVEAAKSDPAAWADVTSSFDVRAALAFYRELAALPPDYLVDHLPCPLFAFWGERDEEIARAGGTRGLAIGLDQRGLPYTSYPAHDHGEMFARINDAVPEVLAWLTGTMHS